jgi:hypothetical protein
MDSKYVPPNETVMEMPGGIDYFDVPNVPVEGAEATLESLAKFAQEMKDVEKEIADLEAKLGERKGRHDKISGAIIPEMMEKLGMEEFKLKDGSKVSVKVDIKCGLTEERKPAGFAWLRDNDFGGIIKTALSLSFGKNEEADAQRAVEVLAEAGFHANVGDSVHPATLKSFVKERIKAGDNIPLDTFGVYEFKQTKIVLPKTRK